VLSFFLVLMCSPWRLTSSTTRTTTTSVAEALARHLLQQHHLLPSQCQHHLEQDKLKGHRTPAARQGIAVALGQAALVRHLGKQMFLPLLLLEQQ
jgi:hypothetical protein